MTAQLKSFVERIERIEEEIKAGNDDKRDIYAEAKSAGFDVKALKVVIGRRRKDSDELSELEALVETYEAALGTPVATRVRARPEPAPAEERSPPIRKVPAAPSGDWPEMPSELKRERAAASV